MCMRVCLYVYVKKRFVQCYLKNSFAMRMFSSTMRSGSSEWFSTMKQTMFGEISLTYMFSLSTRVLKPLLSLVQLCLKFFIMFEIFSKRFGSSASPFAALLEQTTRKVERSKRTISQASMTPLSFFKLAWWSAMFGIREHTIWDQAL